MGLVFEAAINSRGYTEGQKLFFCGVSRTSLSDKIKLMWLFVLISKAAGCCNVFGMAGIGGEKRVGKSSPPGAVNTHNHFCFSDNCFQKQAAKENQKHYGGTLASILQGGKSFSFCREDTLQANPKYPSA